MHVTRVSILVVIVASSVLAPGTCGRNRSSPPIIRLVDDRLGESLKEFRSRHRKAACHRRSNEEGDERTSKAHWLAWVDCSVERGVSFMGVETLAEADPAHPLGMFATFHDKQLVELSYTLAIRSTETLLPRIASELGEPTRVVPAGSNEPESFTWIGQSESLTLEVIPVRFVAAGPYLLIGSNAPLSAVRVRIYFNISSTSRWD